MSILHPILCLRATALVQLTRIILPVIALFMGSSALAQHDAHVHGEAELMVAWADSTLIVALDTPAYNVFGKPAPENDADMVKLDTLKKGGWLMFTESLNCPIVTAELEHPFAPGHHDEHDKEHEDERKGHNDIKLSLTYHCPHAPSPINFAGLFELMPKLHEAKAQWLTNQKQSAVTLTPKTSVIDLQ